MIYREFSMIDNNSALIVIDVQNDFCPGGGLAVEQGDEVVGVINKIMPEFKYTAATQDWHPATHGSFASNHEGKKIYDFIDLNGIDQILWPDHCIQGTSGADFHNKLNTEMFNIIIRKGTNPDVDSYSAFFENDKKTSTGLSGYLHSLSLKKLFFCGLATDYCVFYSAMDSVALGFETFLILDACRGVGFPEGSVEKALNEMKEAGVKIINSGDLS